MQRAKKNDVIAVGPVFKDRSGEVSPRRVMLIKNRNEQGDTNEYVVMTQRKPTPGSHAAPAGRQRVAAGDFTHAVRMFCDHILEQAWRDDLRHDGEPRG